MPFTFDIHRLLMIFSYCLDFDRQGISRHHGRVAYIALNIAEEIGLPEKEKDTLFIASIVHDAGVSTWRDKEYLQRFEVDEPWEHCRAGSEIVKKVDLLKPASPIILSHHDRFAASNNSGLNGSEIPLAARIIHLADRVDVLLREKVYVLYQKDKILDTVKMLAGCIFDPDLVKALTSLSRKESFWLGLVSPFTVLPHKLPELPLGEVDLRQISEMFATVIDRKSHFTHLHSRRVAAVAVKLAETLGFGQEDLFLLGIAGLLHDIGKLSIPDEILEKPGTLTKEEFTVIRQHTYYTYQILKESGTPFPIPEWAAYHHEKLDGSGYPFHIDASGLSTGSRIVAAADVFTALREDRPYRTGLNRHKIEEILKGMILDKALDGQIVNALFDIYNDLEIYFNRAEPQ